MNRRIWFANRRSSQNLVANCNGLTKERTMHPLSCRRGSKFVPRVRSVLLRKKNGRITNGKLKENIKAGIKRLKEEMAEISEEQNCIGEGQKQMREKLEKIEAEREQLWKETEIIAKQNAKIHSRLSLMLGIVKARAQNDSDLAAQLTQSLRDLVAERNEEMP